MGAERGVPFVLRAQVLRDADYRVGPTARRNRHRKCLEGPKIIGDAIAILVKARDDSGHGVVLLVCLWQSTAYVSPGEEGSSERLLVLSAGSWLR